MGLAWGGSPRGGGGGGRGPGGEKAQGDGGHDSLIWNRLTQFAGPGAAVLWLQTCLPRPRTQPMPMWLPGGGKEAADAEGGGALARVPDDRAQEQREPCCCRSSRAVPAEGPLRSGTLLACPFQGHSLEKSAKRCLCLHLVARPGGIASKQYLQKEPNNQARYSLGGCCSVVLAQHLVS